MLYACFESFQRVVIVDSWHDFEQEYGSAEEQGKVGALKPKRIKKRRLSEGGSGEFEEYFDYIFPGEDELAPKLKILEMALKWKKQKTAEDE
jgi:crooked neck